MEDSELVQRCRAGSREAFGELVRRHSPAIIGFAASALSDPSQAEDAAQEIFLKAYRSLGEFRGDSAFLTWLRRIAANHCLDLLRSRGRRPAESLDALVEREGDGFRRLLAQGSLGPRPEDADLVRRALAALPDDHRVILVLREVQGLTYAELTEALECSLDAVKSRLRRARQGLEESLRHFLGPDDV